MQALSKIISINKLVISIITPKIKNLKERNIPVIIISHNLRQVFDLVDKIAVFRQGKIIDIVKTNEVSGNDVVALITGLNKKTEKLVNIFKL